MIRPIGEYDNRRERPEDSGPPIYRLIRTISGEFAQLVVNSNLRPWDARPTPAPRGVRLHVHTKATGV